MVTATMVLVRLGPMMATMRMASTRLGIDMIRSMMRRMITSMMPPNQEAASPRTTPVIIETTITERPMKREMRLPYMSRESMSRPSGSVPRG